MKATFTTRSEQRSHDTERGPAAGEEPQRRGGAARDGGVTSPNTAAAVRRALSGRQTWRSTASISRFTWTLSLTTTPPPSSGMAMSTPKSLRLIVVLAENPARVPP